MWYPHLSIKKLHVLQMAGYNNKFNNMISMMQRMFHCSLHISVVV